MILDYTAVGNLRFFIGNKSDAGGFCCPPADFGITHKNRLFRSQTKSIEDSPNRFGVELGFWKSSSFWQKGLGAALKAAYLAGESPAPGIAYLPGQSYPT